MIHLYLALEHIIEIMPMHLFWDFELKKDTFAKNRQHCIVNSKNTIELFQEKYAFLANYGIKITVL